MPQLHAGSVFSEEQRGKPVWNTNSEGKYWCGLWHDRTPKELLLECRSIIADLICNHPELIDFNETKGEV